MKRVTLPSFVLLFTLGACQGSGEPAPEPTLPDAPPAPWPSTFEEEAAILAEEVYIEGPPALRAHIAVRQDPAIMVIDQETVPEGLRIVTSAKPGAGPVRISAHLDNLSIIATHRLTVLERPIATPVVVEARGDVFYSKSGVQERPSSLRLVGE